MLDIGPLQLKALGHLWAHGPQTVGQVHERLNADRTASGEKELAYTTSLTVLRNLNRRQLVSRETAARGHVYRPIVAKSDFQTRVIRQLLAAAFDGDKAALRSALDAA